MTPPLLPFLLGLSFGLAGALCGLCLPWCRLVPLSLLGLSTGFLALPCRLLAASLSSFFRPLASRPFPTSLPALWPSPALFPLPFCLRLHPIAFPGPSISRPSPLPRSHHPLASFHRPWRASCAQQGASALISQSCLPRSRRIASALPLPRPSVSWSFSGILGKHSFPVSIPFMLSCYFSTRYQLSTETKGGFPFSLVYESHLADNRHADGVVFYDNIAGFSLTPPASCAWLQLDGHTPTGSPTGCRPSRISFGILAASAGSILPDLTSFPTSTLRWLHFPLKWTPWIPFSSSSSPLTSSSLTWSPPSSSLASHMPSQASSWSESGLSPSPRTPTGVSQPSPYLVPAQLPSATTHCGSPWSVNFSQLFAGHPLPLPAKTGKPLDETSSIRPAARPGHRPSPPLNMLGQLAHPPSMQRSRRFLTREGIL